MSALPPEHDYWMKADRDAWKRKYEASAAQHVTEIDAAILSAYAQAERDLRKELWLRHHPTSEGLYGDDGEMQCNRCLIDFKRDSIATIGARLLNADPKR